MELRSNGIVNSTVFEELRSIFTDVPKLHLRRLFISVGQSFSNLGRQQSKYST